MPETAVDEAAAEAVSETLLDTMVVPMGHIPVNCRKTWAVGEYIAVVTEAVPTQRVAGRAKLHTQVWS